MNGVFSTFSVQFKILNSQFLSKLFYFLLITLLMTTTGFMSGCGGGGGGGGENSDQSDQTAVEYSYYEHTKDIIDDNCVQCHQEGSIGPFNLTTYDSVYALRSTIRNSVSNDSMPPWSPDNSCRSYSNNRSLSSTDKSALLSWIDQGAKEGNAALYRPPPAKVTASIDYDYTLTMAEPYTPNSNGNDDYRCFIMTWPETSQTKYIVGTEFDAGRDDMAHHMLAYAIPQSDIATYQAFDDADEGPGYSCFGGPGGDINDLTEVAGWVPGVAAVSLPSGTGIRVEPNSYIVMQMHYNIVNADPTPDSSSLSFLVEDSVAAVGKSILLANPAWLQEGGMPIPAQSQPTTHSWSFPLGLFIPSIADDIGIESGDNINVYSANLHMHQLGTTATATVSHGDGGTDCLLDIPEWDFNWQGGYEFSTPVEIDVGDVLNLSCTWDNSENNQPTIDGEIKTASYVEWGDGTADEMCLVGVYVTKANE